MGLSGISTPQDQPGKEMPDQAFNQIRHIAGHCKNSLVTAMAETGMDACQHPIPL
jgi:hypothetical protein